MHSYLVRPLLTKDCFRYIATCKCGLGRMLLVLAVEPPTIEPMPKTFEGFIVKMCNLCIKSEDPLVILMMC